MTERPAGSRDTRPRKTRLTGRALRAWAWIVGAVALFAPLTAIAQQPKPTGAAPDRRRPVVIKRLLRRVVVVSPRTNTSTPRVVYVGSGASSAGTSTGATTPVTTTGGSAPA